MALTAVKETLSCLFAREPTEVSRARETTRKALFDWGLGEHSDLSEIIVSEFVTNALRHGEGPIRMRISCDGSSLRIEVHDDGPGRPVRRPVTPLDESGHGLELIDCLLSDAGGQRRILVDADGEGKTVCAAIRLAANR